MTLAFVTPTANAAFVRDTVEPENGWRAAMVDVELTVTGTPATIELAADQRVISTGLYAFVRHPMYASLLMMFLGIPIALGSCWDALVFVAIIPALI